jgi:hypothetical protein
MARRLREFDKALQAQIDTADREVQKAEHALELAKAAREALFAVRDLSARQRAAKAAGPAKAAPRRRRGGADQPADQPDVATPSLADA